jgi:short-subunit dehydrogenase
MNGIRFATNIPSTHRRFSMQTDGEGTAGQAPVKTVVITGAASGIGKAAAIEFARKRYRVVAVARSEKGLKELVTECELLGATILTRVADVTDQVGIKTVAASAAARFGGIDVWVNNAGVLLYGRFGEMPHELFRRVIDTNLFGCIHGSRAVLPYFREQGQGVLINMASLAGLLGMPYSSAYAASKAAIGAFSQTLRMELADTPGIRVCTVFPASTDTPLFQHAANYMGLAARPVGPVYRAEKVALEIVRLAEKPRREVIVGASAKAGYLMHLIMPGVTERVMAGMALKAGFQDKEKPITDGNLFRPDDGLTTIGGGWKGMRGRPGLKRKAALGALVPGIGALGRVFRRLYLRHI